MPSQAPAAAAIPLVHAPDGRGYRLLELPDGFDVNAKWSLVADDTGLARMCSTAVTDGNAGPSYALRQKNTSNALVLLAAGHATGADSAAPLLAAVATLHETVELVEEKRPTAVGAAAAAPTSAPAAPKTAPSRGRWHEKFGRTR